MFYGREKLTARMLSMLHRNSLMITGERRIGKTTFLHHLKRVLAEDEGGEWRFFPVFVDLQGVPEQALLPRAHGRGRRHASSSPRRRARQLRFAPEPEGYDARDFSHDLQQVIAELQDAHRRRKVKLALLIDEVDVLNEYSESVNQRLRGIFMKSFSENLVAVMSGVGIQPALEERGQPLVQLLRRDRARSPSRARRRRRSSASRCAGVFRWSPRPSSAILELSQLRPYLVQKLCVHAVNRMLEAGPQHGPPGGRRGGARRVRSRTTACARTAPPTRRRGRAVAD